MDVAKEIRSFDKTARSCFYVIRRICIESYSVKAFNYILKPIFKEKFFITFDEMLEQVKVKMTRMPLSSRAATEFKESCFRLVFAEVTGRKVLYHLLSEGHRMYGAFSPFVTF